MPAAKTSIKAVVICNSEASLLVLFTAFSQVNVDLVLKTEGGRVLLQAQIKIFFFFFLVWLGEGRIPALMMEAVLLFRCLVRRCFTAEEAACLHLTW